MRALFNAPGPSARTLAWIFCGLALLTPCGATGQTIAWTNAGGGTFSTAGNWAGGVVPGVGNTAAFALNNAYAVTFANSPSNLNLLLSAGTVSFLQSGTQTYSLSGVANIVGGSHTFTGLTVNATGGALGMSGGGRLTVNGGGDVIATSFTIANGSDATFTVSGSGSRFVATGAGTSYIGRSGGAGYVTFTDSSVGSFSGQLGLAQSGIPGSSGTLLITNGADVTVGGNVSVGTSGETGQIGYLNLDGPGAVSFTQTGGGSMTIGAAANSAGTVDVTGPFVNSTGLLTINQTGTLLIRSSGSVTSAGSVFFNGGYALVEGSSSAWSVAGTLNIQTGQIELNRGRISAHTLLGLEHLSLNVGTLDTATISINGGQLVTSSSIFNVRTSLYNDSGTVSLQLSNGASFSTSFEIRVGGTGAGIMHVLSGSDVSTEHLGIYPATSGDALVVVDGAGSSVQLEQLTVGTSLPAPSGRAKISLRNGGSLSIAPSFTSTTTIGAYGLLEILSGGSAFLGDNANLSGGNVAGHGALIRLDGGTLSLSSAAVLDGFAATVSPDDGGSMEFNAGTIIFRNASTLNAPAIDAMLGPARTLGFGRIVRVLGTATFASSMTLDGGTLSVNALANAAQLQLIRGVLEVNSGSLTVGAGGPFGGQFSIPSGMTVNTTGLNVASGGLLQLDGARFSAAGSISNAGEIQLLGGAAQLSAATLNNSGVIGGYGRINARLTNTAAGIVRLASGDYLLFQGPTNSNSGTINLLGGVIEFSAASLTNSSTGRILGRGSLIAPSGIANAGTMTLSGGQSEVIGVLSNASTARVTVTGGAQASFYSDVINTAGSVFKVSDASVAAFLGSVTGLGAFTGSGTILFEGPAGFGELARSGTTVVDITGQITPGHIRESSLVVRGNAQITTKASSNDPSGTSVVETLAVPAGGQLDLSNNAMIVNYSGASPAGQIIGYLRTGFADGNWNGPGITSSAAGMQPRRSLGVAEASDIGSPATFAGQAIDASAVLVLFTLPGDANLNGSVNIGDFSLLASHFNQPGYWAGGDFNYNGVVEIGDFSLLAANFNLSLSSDVPGAAPVPEPSALAVALGCCAAAATRRRRPGN